MKPRGSADLRARDSQQFHLGVVVLGAGASTRMGRPKMLLPWGGSTIVGHAINIWRKLGAAQIAVVHAERDVPMITELKRLQLPASGRIANPAPAQGMFSSVLCAAQWPRWEIGLTHWLVSLGDQPHLRMSTLHRLV
ncbi:MAG TPA: NTP transferase domain-containing protein, partial [Chthoniobacteraceae bacterium]|nr:NTP transferase domain-containing protein [Chthoniobacteraceae bacterium]